MVLKHFFLSMWKTVVALNLRLGLLLDVSICSSWFVMSHSEQRWWRTCWSWREAFQTPALAPYCWGLSEAAQPGDRRLLQSLLYPESSPAHPSHNTTWRRVKELRENPPKAHALWKESLLKALFTYRTSCPCSQTYFMILSYAKLFFLLHNLSKKLQSKLPTVVFLA